MARWGEGAYKGSYSLFATIGLILTALLVTFFHPYVLGLHVAD